MKKCPENCPTKLELEAFLRGDLEASEAAVLEARIDGCSQCQTSLANLSADAEWHRLLPSDRQLHIDTDNDPLDTDADAETKPRSPELPEIEGYSIARRIAGGIGSSRYLRMERVLASPSSSPT